MGSGAFVYLRCPLVLFPNGWVSSKSKIGRSQSEDVYCLQRRTSRLVMQISRRAKKNGGSGSSSTSRTKKEVKLPKKRKSVVVGINKYSHDASVAIVDVYTGELLFALAKERMSRRKHDGGAVGELLEDALAYLNLDTSNIELVVQNNHHYRISDFERRMPFAISQGYVDASLFDDYNLLPDCQGKIVEISHHLAHAYSVAPFLEDDSLVVVMDGMGEAYREMVRAMIDPKADKDYHHDLPSVSTTANPKDPHIALYPEHSTQISGAYGYREAETVYLWNNQTKALSIPIFKRWTREISAPELYNHGFENMESIGAVYSRIASNLFNNWNACGKVMGLASWGQIKQTESVLSQTGANRVNNSSDAEKNVLSSLMEGSLIEGTFKIDHDTLQSLPESTKGWTLDTNSPGFKAAAALAARVQADLEAVALPFLNDLKVQTKAKNLAYSGGVALNSTLNGRIISESGFDRVLLTPFPGDEGTAIGCALYGYFLLKRSAGSVASDEDSESRLQLTPYLGKKYSSDEIQVVIDDYMPWLDKKASEFELPEGKCLETVSDLVSQGQVIAWFQGRSESGPRALGNRSLLADPRNADMVDHVNSNIKNREIFRPFAPSVLVEHVAEFFEFPSSALNPSLAKYGSRGVSPFMSMTLCVKNDKQSLVPAITHIDGTARLQTVCEQDNPRYYKLISAFYRKTQIPMLMNTSLNIKGEPIVETPNDAMKSFLESPMDALVFEASSILRKTRIEDLDASWMITYRTEVPYRVERVTDMFGNTIRSKVFILDESGNDRCIEFTDNNEFEIFDLIQSSEENVPFSVQEVVDYLDSLADAADDEQRTESEEEEDENGDSEVFENEDLVDKSLEDLEEDDVVQYIRNLHRYRLIACRPTSQA